MHAHRIRAKMYVKEKNSSISGKNQASWEKTQEKAEKTQGKTEKTQGKAEKLIVRQSTFMVYAENSPKKNPCFIDKY